MHSRAVHPQCPECRSDTDYVFMATPAPERRLRMRSSAEITKRVTGDIRKLNTRLLDISNRLAIALQKHEVARTPQGRILVALFRKAVNTFRGIETLMSNRLIEESFVLLRVLLETHVNMIYFMKNDSTEVTRRWSDAAMLEKIKYLREVNFLEGTELAHMGHRDQWEAAEAEITERYSNAELHLIRRNGYSGLSVQQRAQAIGLGAMYSNCYRIASRSVHTFDPAETGLMDYVEDQETVDDLLSSRRDMLESTQNLLLGRLSYLMSEIAKDPLMSMQMFVLGVGYEKYRDQKEGTATAESQIDPATFYIWRE